MNFEFINENGSALTEVNPTVIKIVGCGGGGSNAVNELISEKVEGVEFIVLNTDVQALNKSNARHRIAIGQKITGGLGAGGNPEVGEKSAKEDIEKIKNILSGSDMVIVTAGMGGGTGTGSAPIVANVARSLGALTVAVVTTPFLFEGKVRMNHAVEGIEKLRKEVDSLIVIPNETVRHSKDLTFKESFKLADTVLCQGVKGISDIIIKTGIVNVDFADVRTVMQGKGEAVLGVGSASGDNRAVDAASKAINNPLLENRKIDGAKNILVNITAPVDIKMDEVDEIVNTIRASAAEEDNVFWGQLENSDSEDTNVYVTVIATGFEDEITKSEEGIQQEGLHDVLEGKVLENEDVLSAAAFDSLLGVKPSGSLFDEKDLSGESVNPSAVLASTSLEEYGSMKSFNMDPNDINTPAFLRKKANGLTTTINFNRK